MIVGHNTGFRCPACGVASPCEVEECDACGYESAALRRWRREARRQERRESREGCLSVCFDSLFWIDGVVALAGLVGRAVLALTRAIVSIWT